MIIRLKIAIGQEEYAALLKLAQDQFRNPESQLHYILQEELRRQGLITSTSNVSENKTKMNSTLLSSDIAK